MTIRHRAELLNSIANTIADYRHGEIAVPTPDHVDKWVRQFEQFGAEAALQSEILHEMDHVLRQTYISRDATIRFLSGLVAEPSLVGENASGFWRSVNFLRLQQRGNSQIDLLALLDNVLMDRFGFRTHDCGVEGGPFFYLDDCLFTGNRILGDLSRWLESAAPDHADVHVYLLACHRSGWWYAYRNLQKAASIRGAMISWWSEMEIEDRKDHTNVSQVLRPTKVPNDPLVTAYEQELVTAGYRPILRRPIGSAGNSPFSCEARREALEQTFLRAGAYIRSLAQNPNPGMRPLGATMLRTFGFGALVVTYRNCANNCPIAFWWGVSNWYPLFPRKVNTPPEVGWDSER